jgi:dGTPase
VDLLDVWRRTAIASDVPGGDNMGHDLTALEKRIHRDEPPRSGDIRNSYQRDRARIIHSAGFRRLQGKTQVMGTGEGDFHRTRLTHTLEAAQIGQGLVKKLLNSNLTNNELKSILPPSALIEAACLAHDLGHPPYGHAGERALHGKMQAEGGFEGNGQTLRILTTLEKYACHTKA